MCLRKVSSSACRSILPLLIRRTIDRKYPGVSNAVPAGCDIIFVKLKDIDHGCCGADSAQPLHRFSPRAWMSPQGGPEEAPCRNEIRRVPDRVGIIGDHGTGFDDQSRQRQMRRRCALGGGLRVVPVAVVTSLTQGFLFCLNVPAIGAVTACLIKGFFSEMSHLGPGFDEPGREGRPRSVLGYELSKC